MLLLFFTGFGLAMALMNTVPWLAWTLLIITLAYGVFVCWSLATHWFLHLQDLPRALFTADCPPGTAAYSDLPASYFIAGESMEPLL